MVRMRTKSSLMEGVRQSRFLTIKTLEHGDELCEESSDDGDNRWEFNRDRLKLGKPLTTRILCTVLP